MKNKKARSFVVIMIVIALSALLLRVLVDKIIRSTSAQNEFNAQATLKLISTALENYAKDNRGAYPDKIAVLTQGSLAYLDRDYVKQSPVKGYSYNCGRLDASGYSCQALPTRCKLTGRAVFTVTTGSLLISEDCDRKE
jgi:type II secretory pathway pseudopilin PulG